MEDSIVEFRWKSRLKELWDDHRTKLWIILGPLLGFPFLFIEMGDPVNAKISRTCFIAVWMGCYWVTEPIPLSATAFMPLLLYPLFGVVSASVISKAYINDTMFLLLGSFFFSAAIEKWDLHTRLAYRFLMLIGPRPKLLFLGFMSITGFLSLWISNTATTAMMVPLAIAIIKEVEKQQYSDESNDYQSEKDQLLESSYQSGHSPSSAHLEQLKGYTTALLLGIAYASSIGGCGSLIGTGTNLVFVQQLKIMFPSAPEVSFGEWFAMMAPLACIFTLLVWGVLVLMFARKTDFTMNSSVIKAKYEELGSMTFAQKFLLFDLVVMIALWFSRTGFGPDSKGWGELFSPRYVSDSTVMVFGVFVLFFVPSMDNGQWNDQTKPILDNTIWNEVAWDAFLLLAGGFGLATGIMDSGLAALLRDKLAFFHYLPLWVLLFVLGAVVLLFTEFTSNTSTITVFAPVMGMVALAVGQDPRLLMILATIISSYDFMLPVGTPPNTIVYSTGKIRITQMMMAGAVINLCALFVLPSYLMLTARGFGITLGVVPEWATLNGTTI